MSTNLDTNINITKTIILFIPPSCCIVYRFSFGYYANHSTNSCITTQLSKSLIKIKVMQNLVIEKWSVRSFGDLQGSINSKNLSPLSPSVIFSCKTFSSQILIKEHFILELQKIITLRSGWKFLIIKELLVLR